MKKMIVFAGLVLAACGGAKEEAPAADTSAMMAPAADTAAMMAPADTGAMMAPAMGDSVMAGDTAKKM